MLLHPRQRLAVAGAAGQLRERQVAGLEHLVDVLGGAAQALGYRPDTATVFDEVLEGHLKKSPLLHVMAYRVIHPSARVNILVVNYHCGGNLLDVLSTIRLIFKGFAKCLGSLRQKSKSA